MPYVWRGQVTTVELNRLHADAFGHRLFGADEWDWERLLERHSLGWVTARHGDDLVGFANVVWDGLVHAWLQDVMVVPSAQRQGIGMGLVSAARDGARDAGCEWLHVDFDDELADFYINSCGFAPASAGLIRLP